MTESAQERLKAMLISKDFKKLGKGSTGFGMGLYLSQSLMEVIWKKHLKKGRNSDKISCKIGFKSTNGRGSSFWFRIPIANSIPTGPLNNYQKFLLPVLEEEEEGQENILVECSKERTSVS